MSNGYILGRGMRLYLDGITRRREDGRTRLREQLRGALLAENDWERPSGARLAGKDWE